MTDVKEYRRRADELERRLAAIDREMEKCHRLIRAGLLTHEEAFHVAYNNVRKAAGDALSAVDANVGHDDA